MIVAFIFKTECVNILFFYKNPKQWHEWSVGARLQFLAGSHFTEYK